MLYTLFVYTHPTARTIVSISKANQLLGKTEDTKKKTYLQECTCATHLSLNSVCAL